jgi:hypothetical protein
MVFEGKVISTGSKGTTVFAVTCTLAGKQQDQVSVRHVGKFCRSPFHVNVPYYVIFAYRKGGEWVADRCMVPATFRPPVYFPGPVIR